ncbi:hypothetical protein NKH18_49020 [Streptomyces sp. M10(2022)]
MQHHTAMSTEWIIAQGVADEIAAAAQGAQVVLADRAAYDAFAYYTAALEFRDEHPVPAGQDRLRILVGLAEQERLRLLAATQAPKYDLLLATVLDPSVPVDKSHDYDARYRALVDEHVHSLLADEELDHVRVTSAAHSHTDAIRHAVELALKAATDS